MIVVSFEIEIHNENKQCCYLRGEIKKEVSKFFIPKPKQLHKIGNVRLKATPIVYKKTKKQVSACMQASMVWKHPWSPPPKKFKVTQSAVKIMATVFWDYRGVLLVDFNPKGHTINAQMYSETLKRLKLAIKRKRPDRNVGDVILLHDNARPHVARVVSDQIASWGWQVLKHPPYSPDLAPSDYHLFGPLKRGLAGQHFGNDNEVKEAVRQWLRCQPDSFFRQGIENLVVRWDKCLNTLGDYVEK